MNIVTRAWTTTERQQGDGVVGDLEDTCVGLDDATQEVASAVEVLIVLDTDGPFDTADILVRVVDDVVAAEETVGDEGCLVVGRQYLGVEEADGLDRTEVLTPDNKAAFIPNGLLSSNSVVNYSHENTRRVDWTIGIEYNEDIDRARNLLRSIIESDSRILKVPNYTIALLSLGASSVNIVIRAWTANETYWDVFFDINERIYKEFNAAGIGFPFPQLTVHQAK